jgi:hypothetical protein
MKKTLEEWAVQKGIEILDPDGFDRADPDLYTRKRTEEEFEKGVGYSTIVVTDRDRYQEFVGKLKEE